MSQRKYTLEILDDTSLTRGKPENFPMEQNLKLTLTDGDLLHVPTKYRRLVGRLIYLTVTRPYIIYWVSTLSQFMQEPHKTHWDATLRVLNYNKGTPRQWLLLPFDNNLKMKSLLRFKLGRMSTWRSYSSYCIFMGNSLVSWKYKKQTNLSRSSVEAEYQATTNTCLELTLLRYILRDLKLPIPTPLYCYNQATLHIAANPVFHKRTKHIEINCYIIRKKSCKFGW